MLFNSYTFIFLFLPVTLAGFLLISRWRSGGPVMAWLLAASLFFIGWWSPPYLILIAASLAFNYTTVVVLSRLVTRGGPRPVRVALAVGIAFNLSLLGYYKYADFFVDTLNRFPSLSLDVPSIILPIAISFYTLQQIAYLVDVYNGKARGHDFLRYCLFVMFFPQLIAGPIVRHNETMHQFGRKLSRRFSHDLAVGVTIFSAGLFEKVILADGVGRYADFAFNAAAGGGSPSFLEAWGGALAFTLQIYFDFSGYSNMAIGLGRMFGIRLPLNFNAPYRATSIIDFWRRWHMTLSRFLRDYFYVPLGGNRKGRNRRYLNLMTIMLVGGLWHGAGWTFIFWGALHGMYLVINHGWRAVRPGGTQEDGSSSRLGAVIAAGLTFVCVVVAWVFFRAASWNTATEMIRGMVGFNGVSLPVSWEGRHGFLGSLPVRYDGLGSLATSGTAEAAAWIVGVLALVWFLPATHQWMARARPTLEPVHQPAKWLWRPSIRWAIVVGTGGVIALFGMVSRVNEYIYFKF